MLPGLDFNLLYAIWYISGKRNSANRLSGINLSGFLLQKSANFKSLLGSSVSAFPRGAFPFIGFFFLTGRVE